MNQEDLLLELQQIDKKITESQQCAFDFFYGVAGFPPFDMESLEERKKQILKDLGR